MDICQQVSVRTARKSSLQGLVSRNQISGGFLSTRIAVKYYQMWRQSCKKPQKINSYDE